jgi:hypothetical protein
MAGKTLLLSVTELKRADPDSRQTEKDMGVATSAFTPYGMSESGASCHTMTCTSNTTLLPFTLHKVTVQAKCHTDGIFSHSANLQNCESYY